MKRLGTGRTRWIGGVMALTMTLASVLANSVQTVQDKDRVAKMTNKMKTVCVGRFLIDLPVEVEATVKRGFVSGFDFSSSMLEDDVRFDSRLAHFEAELQSPSPKHGRRRLENEQMLSAGPGRGKVFVYDRHPARTIDDDNRIVEIEDVSARGMLRYGDLSVTASADGATLDVGARLKHVLKQTRPLKTDEIPSEGGFCIADALIRDPYEHRGNESVVLFAGLPGHPDVNIVFSSMAGTAPAPGLLARHAESLTGAAMFMRLAMTDLRAGERHINELKGEELLMRIREPNFTTGYLFRWESAGKKNDIVAPLLTLELESGTNPVTGGKPVQSTLSEEAMFQLWESIVSTIRLRPIAPPQAQAQAPDLALGSDAFAGDPCPRTGWWECSDGGHGIGVLGGQRQFVREGQRMPQALLLPTPTMWQRLRGVQPSFESANPTVWVLADKRGNPRGPQPPGLQAAGAAAELAAMVGGTVARAHAEAPIGSVAKTGAACPASGWWRCEDSQALDGTRWFAAGSQLPEATFQKRSPRGNVGHTERIYRRSAWHLVRHAMLESEATNRHDVG